MPPAAFLHPENAPKSLAAGALPQTQLIIIIIIISFIKKADKTQLLQ